MRPHVDLRISPFVGVIIGLPQAQVGRLLLILLMGGVGCGGCGVV